ncbi:MAG: ABC transporter ATP-binding protein [Candidatus Pelagibacter sp. TMED118]|nr:MAG: ABC transporter ATP-binding protein [Candidatus Pelagibacter sp. TMED118]|tara:strand:+ start:2482 stop:3411 length:930 start_codon:yes stop_codon:yes gene_type:complete
MNKKNVLKVSNLKKIYAKNGSNSIEALKDLNLEVKQGEIFGLLGPNGAGKSTFINILAGLVIKSSGSVNVWGFDIDVNPRQVRASIGIVPQEVNLDPFFSPKKLLELQAGMYGVKKKDRITDTILSMVSLNNQAKSYSRGLSGGMKRRLMIAKALVHQPPIIILDEPTAGVDVELRKNLWDNIRLLNNSGVTVILTTHYLKEAEEMCDRVAIINKGELIALDSTENLLRRIKHKIVRLTLNKDIDIDNNSLSSLKILSNSDKLMTLSYEKDKLKIGEIINYLSKKDIEIIDMSTDDGDLEDVFVTLINN